MAWINDTDAEWKRWGDHDPYFAVLSSQRFRRGGNIDEFFQTGTDHFNQVKANFKRLAIPLDPEGIALDFGCGVGRVTKALGSYFNKVIGLDVSPAMLSEARKHVNSPKIDFRLLDNDNPFQCLEINTFQYIHTYLVLQHIRPKRGRIFLRTLLRHLESNGKAYIHTPIRIHNRFKYISDQVVVSHPFLLKLSRTLLGKWERKNDPVMQMNVYAAEPLLELFTEERMEIRYVSLFKDAKNQLTHACWYLYKP